MHTYKKQFIEFCIQNKVIQFGKFTLKSRRTSPYFFNTGLFNSGQTIFQLGKFYATAIKNAKIDFDILFGPAYKGIPLVTTTAIALSEKYNINKNFCFNRKTIKDHGEGGNLIGAPLKGKILVVDDVITAGTIISKITKTLHNNSGILHGLCIALNRQEKGNEGKLSAIQEIKQKYNIKMISIITLQDIITYIQGNNSFAQHLESIKTYQKKYGIVCP